MTQTNIQNDIVFDLNDFIAVIRKRWLLIFIIYLALFVATFIYCYKKKPVYKTNFTLNISEIPVDTKEIVENFNMLYGDDGIYRNSKKNDALSAEILNLKKIEIQKQVEDQNNKLETTLTISIFVYNASSINPIIKELINYCNSNSFFTKKEKIDKEKKTNIILNYKKQLNELILYKQKTEKENTNMGSIPYFNVYKDIATLQEYITLSEYNLAEFRGCSIAIDPIIPTRTQGMTLLQCLILVTIFGLILSIFIAFFLDKFFLIVQRPHS